MSYEDLLPNGYDLLKLLVEEEGVEPARAKQVLRQFGHFLNEHSQYYDVQWRLDGEKGSQGAAEALKSLAGDLEDVGREQ